MRRARRHPRRRPHLDRSAVQRWCQAPSARRTRHGSDRRRAHPDSPRRRRTAGGRTRPTRRRARPPRRRPAVGRGTCRPIPPNSQRSKHSAAPDPSSARPASTLTQTAPAKRLQVSGCSSQRATHTPSGGPPPNSMSASGKRQNAEVGQSRSPSQSPAQRRPDRCIRCGDRAGAGAVARGIAIATPRTLTAIAAGADDDRAAVAGRDISGSVVAVVVTRAGESADDRSSQ